MSNDICIYCGGPKAIRNPTGNCDHLYWPDMIPGADKNVDRDRELAAARSAALEEAASEAERAYTNTQAAEIGASIAAAIRELKDK